MKIESDFQEFLSTIEPAKTHVDDAKMGHETLRERLEGDDEYKKKLAGATFLSGSYRRRTAVKPIKDVDIIVPLVNDVTVKPRVCLEELQRVLKKYYDAPKLEKQRRSIRVDLSYVTLDIVPGLAPNGADGVLRIPDREQSRWLDSHPKGHIGWTQDLNRTSGGVYVPAVKAFKWWRTYRLGHNKHPKSFFLECMVAQEITFQADTMGELFYRILRAWRERYKADVDQRRVPLFLDPGLPGRYLETGMTPAEFRAFHVEVKKSEELAASALGSVDEQERAETWQSLFGREFPAPRGTRTIGVPATSRARDAGEQFLSDLDIPERVQYGVRINAQVTQAGFQPFRLRGAQWPLKKKRKLEFYLEACEVPEPYSLKWKVKNIGSEARGANDLRGNIVDDGGYRRKQENTKYAGAHYVECYVIKSGVCVAKDRIEVPIAEV